MQRLLDLRSKDVWCGGGLEVVAGAAQKCPGDLQHQLGSGGRADRRAIVFNIIYIYRFIIVKHKAK